MPANIILLHTDQQRWDSLGCYGNSAARTPNLDRLAAGGALFEHSYCSNPVCMPSRATLLTGRHLPAHGVIDNGIPLDERELTMAGALAAAGYDTYAAGKLHLTPYQSPAGHGHGESFAEWRAGTFKDWHGPYYGFLRADLVLGHGEGAMNPALGHYGRWLAESRPDAFARTGMDKAPEPRWPGCFRSQAPPECHHSTYVADRIIEYLEHAPAGRPFFAFGGFPDPHHPWTPPEAWAAMFDGADLPEPRRRAGEMEGRPEFYRRLQGGNLFPTDGGASGAPEGEHLRRIIQNTCAMVALIDHNVGRILDALDRLGLADETVVAFTCDHGELLGEHGLLHKGQLPYMSLMRVPLIVCAPGAAPLRTGAPIGGADVMPTLMDLAGAPAPAGVQGLSHAPVVRGEADRIREAVFSCGWSKASPDFRHMSLHGDRWRLTWWPGVRDGELYDVARDPGEFDNLFHRPEHRDVRDALMAELLRQYAAAGPLEPHVICNW
jgi:arylsulfatase A-like enzyme